MTEQQKQRLAYLLTKPNLTVDKANEIETLGSGRPREGLHLHEALRLSSQGGSTEGPAETKDR